MSGVRYLRIDSDDIQVKTVPKALLNVGFDSKNDLRDYVLNLPKGFDLEDFIKNASIEEKVEYGMYMLVHIVKVYFLKFTGFNEQPLFFVQSIIHHLMTGNFTFIAKKKVWKNQSKTSYASKNVEMNFQKTRDMIKEHLGVIIKFFNEIPAENSPEAQFDAFFKEKDPGGYTIVFDGYQLLGKLSPLSMNGFFDDDNHFLVRALHETFSGTDEDRKMFALAWKKYGEAVVREEGSQQVRPAQDLPLARLAGDDADDADVLAAGDGLFQGQPTSQGLNVQRRGAPQQRQAAPSVSDQSASVSAPSRSSSPVQAPQVLSGEDSSRVPVSIRNGLAAVGNGASRAVSAAGNGARRVASAAGNGARHVVSLFAPGDDNDGDGGGSGSSGSSSGFDAKAYFAQLEERDRKAINRARSSETELSEVQYLVSDEDEDEDEDAAPPSYIRRRRKQKSGRGGSTSFEMSGGTYAEEPSLSDPFAEVNQIMKQFSEEALSRTSSDPKRSSASSRPQRRSTYSRPKTHRRLPEPGSRSDPPVRPKRSSMTPTRRERQSTASTRRETSTGGEDWSEINNLMAQFSNVRISGKGLRKKSSLGSSSRSSRTKSSLGSYSRGSRKKSSLGSSSRSSRTKSSLGSSSRSSRKKSSSRSFESGPSSTERNYIPGLNIDRGAFYEKRKDSRWGFGSDYAGVGTSHMRGDVHLNDDDDSATKLMREDPHPFDVLWTRGVEAAAREYGSRLTEEVEDYLQSMSVDQYLSALMYIREKMDDLVRFPIVWWAGDEKFEGVADNFVQSLRIKLSLGNSVKVNNVDHVSKEDRANPIYNTRQYYSIQGLIPAKVERSQTGMHGILRVVLMSYADLVEERSEDVRQHIKTLVDQSSVNGTLTVILPIGTDKDVKDNDGRRSVDKFQEIDAKILATAKAFTTDERECGIVVVPHMYTIGHMDHSVPFLEALILLSTAAQVDPYVSMILEHQLSKEGVEFFKKPDEVRGFIEMMFTYLEGNGNTMKLIPRISLLTHPEATNDLRDEYKPRRLSKREVYDDES